jgi:hypothetical protein
MVRYPNAIWQPWKYESSEGPTYFKGLNKPIAAVLHIAQGHASTATAWAAQGHYGASWHYTVCLDGTVLQHLEHEDGGYHAGIASPPAPTPTWTLWKGPGINVNWYTIGIEHEGFSGNGFTEPQRTASRELCHWLATELGFPWTREHFPPHADIDLVNRANDFGPPAYREEHYQFMFEEDELSAEDKARLDAIEKVLNGGLPNVIEDWNKNGNSLLLGYAAEQQKLADHLANHAAGVTGAVPAHKHTPGGVQNG